MKRQNSLVRGCLGVASAAIMALAVVGCDTTPAKQEGTSLAPATKPTTPAVVAVATKPGTAVVAPTPAKFTAIRMKAGTDAEFKDSKGVVWAADSGFEGGSTIDRAGQITITGVTPPYTPELYMAEHYQMDSWSAKVPNGSYVVKLHFSEDYDGITDATGRVFTYAVKDGTASGKTIKEVKDFSPWKASGAQYKAYVDSIPVTVTAGQITVTFTPQTENPQINAIEVLPG